MMIISAEMFTTAGIPHVACCAYKSGIPCVVVIAQSPLNGTLCNKKSKSDNRIYIDPVLTTSCLIRWNITIRIVQLNDDVVMCNYRCMFDICFFWLHAPRRIRIAGGTDVVPHIWNFRRTYAKSACIWWHVSLMVRYLITGFCYLRAILQTMILYPPTRYDKKYVFCLTTGHWWSVSQIKGTRSQN